ncbi:MAG: hypothetical protein HEQ35_28640 [Gloeotrichia echinulata IR180]
MATATTRLYKFYSKYLLAIAALMAVIPLPVQAVTLVKTREAIKANDQIDWSVIGPVFKPLPNSFLAKSQGGLGLSVNIPKSNDLLISSPFVFQTKSTEIKTNFAEGDYLLFAGFNPRQGFPADGNPGPLTINFDQPVFAAGTQLAVDDTFTFDTFISAFDQSNNLLGSFSLPGTSSLILDNSAVFLGISSDKANISQLVFSTSVPNRALAINKLSIVAVPEPSLTLATLAVGVSINVLRQRRRKQQLFSLR